MSLHHVVGFDLQDGHFRENMKVLYYRRRFMGGGENRLLLMVKGTAYFEFERSRVSAQAGHLLLYETAALKGAHGDPAHPPSYLLIVFDLWAAGGAPVKVSSFGLPLCWQSRDPALVRARMEELIPVKRKGASNSGLRTARLGLEILDLVCGEAPAGDSSGNGEFREVDERIGAVLEYLRVHFKDNPSIGELSRQSRLNPVYFARLFKRSTGMPPHRYLLNLKIEKAKQALSQSREPLLVTGDELGFSDYSHFFRTFRRIAGVPPLAFRRGGGD